MVSKNAPNETLNFFILKAAPIKITLKVYKFYIILFYFNNRSVIGFNNRLTVQCTTIADPLIFFYEEKTQRRKLSFMGGNGV